MLHGGWLWSFWRRALAIQLNGDQTTVHSITLRISNPENLEVKVFSQGQMAQLLDSLTECTVKICPHVTYA